LVFAGRGKRVATGAERAEIGAFGERVALELRARQAGVPAAPGLAGPALLLPPEGASGGRGARIALQLPETAPTPPQPEAGPP